MYGPKVHPQGTCPALHSSKNLYDGPCGNFSATYRADFIQVKESVGQKFTFIYMVLSKKKISQNACCINFCQ